MVKIAILGNSHIACVRSAWVDLSSAYNNVSIDFFGSYAETLLNTRREGAKIVPCTDQVRNSWVVTSGGMDFLDTTFYDFIIIHGFFPTFQEWVAIREFFESESFSSRGFRKSCILKSSLVIGHLYQNLADFKGSVIITPKPQPIFSTESKLIDESYYSSLINFAEKSYKSVGLDFISQPKQTLDSGFYTDIYYKKGGLGLGSKPKVGDVTAPSADKEHMNREYGKAYLESVLEKLV